MKLNLKSINRLVVSILVTSCEHWSQTKTGWSIFCLNRNVKPGESSGGHLVRTTLRLNKVFASKRKAIV